MININLLPKEYQVEPPTSMTRLLFVAASFLIALCAFSMYMYVHYTQLQATIDEYNKVKQEREALERTGIKNDYVQIKKLVNLATVRENSVEQIRYTRSEISRKLHEFAQIFYNHPVWVDGLNIKRATVAKKRKKQSKLPIPVYKWTSKGTCVGSELETPIAFHEALEEDSKFYRDLLYLKVPDFSKIEFPDEYQEKIGYTFGLDFEMQVQPPEEDKKKKKK